jgi:dTDP-4-dehydrorhamnose 3,5-epimerase
MSRFDVLTTPLPGLLVVQRLCNEDERGYFSRFFCSEELAAHGFNEPIAQINQTLTLRRGAARGLHFQRPPHAEDKFVSCLRGKVWDVAVDLRCNSPTYLHWHAEILSEQNRRSLLIPRGFAHGFQTLQDGCELFYLHSRPYHPAAEGGLNMTDPALSIVWPLPFTDLSDRDAKQPHVTADFVAL